MSSAKSARGSRQRRARVKAAGRHNQRSAQFVRLSHLRRLRTCQQVAAVCYRIRGDSLEFLLIRTRGSGRWTFPKGNAEPGMTHAQAAALEAFEEAGVHGRIEEASFARYFVRKRTANSAAKSSEKELAINAHLCEVLRLGYPKESNRKRTWLSAKEARQFLREGRKPEEGAEFTRVVDRAIERIKKSRKNVVAENHTQRDFLERGVRQKDALNRVQFEASAEALFAPYFHGSLGPMRHLSAPLGGVKPREILECEVLQFAQPQESNRNPEWSAGRKKPKALGAGIRG